jgi:hypothetical protein
MKRRLAQWTTSSRKLLVKIYLQRLKTISINTNAEMSQKMKTLKSREMTRRTLKNWMKKMKKKNQ